MQRNRIGMFGLALAILLLAGESRAEKTLTFAEAVDLAKAQNLTLKQSAQQVAQSQADAAQARAAFYPNLSVSLAPTQNFGRTFDQTIGQVENQHSSGMRVSATSSVTLFDGGANRAASRAASQDVDASQASQDDTRQNVMYQTASQFLQVCKDQELIKVAQEQVQAQQDQLTRVEGFFQHGTRSRADVLQQQAAVAQAELKLLNAQHDLDISRLRLKQTLNLPADEDIRVVAPGDLKPATTFDQPAALTAEALSNRSDVAAQKAQLAAAEMRIQGAKSGYYPTLSLSGNVGTNYSSLNRLSGFQDQLINLNPTASASLTLSFPIFDRARTRTSVDLAQVQLAREQLAMAQLQQSVAFEIQQAVTDYHSAIKQKEVSAATEASAKEALAAMQARYEMGSATLAEVSQARAAYVDAAVGLVDARYDTAIQYLNAALTSGQIDTAINAIQGGN